MLAAYDRSRSNRREGGAQGVMLFEVDPTDQTALDQQNETQPERRLLLAILADAIVRCRRLATAPRHASIELREAERWIRSDDREWPCSFVNVCEALDIAYGPLRRAVLAWRRTSNRAVTRRALLVKPSRRKRSAAAVAACASVDAPDAGSAASPSSAASPPTAPPSVPTAASSAPIAQSA